VRIGPYIAFAGATWTGKPNVQILTTAIPCHYHDSDIKMRDMLLRHLGAFRNASRSLEHYYKELTPSDPSDFLLQPNPTYPYPTSFTSESMKHTFRYLSELASEHNYILFGDFDSTPGRQKLCIKFTHTARMFIGFAPQKDMLPSFMPSNDIRVAFTWLSWMTSETSISVSTTLLTTTKKFFPVLNMPLSKQISNDFWSDARSWVGAWRPPHFECHG